MNDYTDDVEFESDLDSELLNRAREGMLGFTQFTKEDYEVNWHHRHLCNKLDAFARGDIQHLMVFMPPRHGKSELVSRRFPAFLHGLYPDAEIMAASYLDSLAGDMTIDVQKIMDTPEYAKVFPETKLYPAGVRYSTGTRNSSEHHVVGRNGKYRGQGVGGSFTGKGANFIIIDDPIKGREIADSEAYRNRLWNFYNNDLFSRLETNLQTGRKGQVLITQTRWHESDLSGMLLDLMRKDPDAVQWDILCYPAIRVDMDTASDPRPIGEPLWPKKYSVDQLMEIKASGGTRAWSSLYQQDPHPDGGGLFNGDMFDFVDLPSEFDYKFIMADTAYSDKKENDYTVFTAFGVAQGELYVMDVFRKQIKASEVEEPIIAFINRFKGYGFRGTHIEPKGHGIYLNQMLPRRGVMVPSESWIKDFYSDRRFDKVSRANNIAPHLSNRKVHINRQINLKEDLLHECLAFPRGKHDDFVDTIIDGVKFVFARQLSTLDVL